MQPHRRAFLGALAAGGAASLAACSTTPRRSPAPPPLTLVPFRPNPSQITHVTVCLRPFRALGPRLDVETLGAKRVVHNYGHGGSGWSLSWGSAELAVAKALDGGVQDIAVIGCGAIGLTTALTAQRAGARVTIYAKEPIEQSRSVRATGVWSPDSRVALEPGSAPGFPQTWEQMTRASWRAYEGLLAAPGAPVEWFDRYSLSDGVGPRREDPIGFGHYSDRVADLYPPSRSLDVGTHSLPVARVRHGRTLKFNIAQLTQTLTAEFRARGGVLVVREFHAPAKLAELPQSVIVNCTGYGARALWGDASVTPVRGQIAWLAPQPGLNYGLTYRNVSMIGRRDGIVLQQTGDDEGWGWNNANETVDPTEAQGVVSVYQELAARAGRARLAVLRRPTAA